MNSKSLYIVFCFPVAFCIAAEKPCKMLVNFVSIQV